MRLKLLTLSLLGLSISACSTISTQNQGATLESKAVNGLNAVYEYPSYDFNGQFKFSSDYNKSSQKTVAAEKSKQTLEPALQNQVNAFLRAQNIPLTEQQKKQLFDAMLQESANYRSVDDTDVPGLVMNLLSDIQLKFDGSIHYRQKMGALNLTFRYEKPTLLVQAKVPMVLDLQNYKFYTNYFALIPMLVNRENQANLAYLDFSKYKNEIDKINLKPLVTYLKESSAVSYKVADPSDIEKLSLTAQDKAQGVVEKIRLNTSLEELLLQMRLYELVNKTYMSDQFSAFKDELEKKESTVDSEDEESVSTLEAHGMTKEEAEAYQASRQLYSLVNKHFYGDEESEEEDEGSAATDAAAEAVEAEDCESAEECAAHATAAAADAVAAADAADDESEEEAEEAEEASGLSSKACDSLAESKKQPAIGDVTYCYEEYGIQLIKPSDSATPTGEAQKEAARGDIENAANIGKVMFSTTALTATFEQYADQEFKDAQAFKVLWDKHQPEIKKELAQLKSQNPMEIDVGLDDKGRAVQVNYNVGYQTESVGKLNFRMDMNILNYGNATAIDRNALKNAKSFEEASKGSFLSQVGRRFGSSLGLEENGQAVQDLDDQLDTLAVELYDQTRSYSKTYQGLFILKMTAEHPELVKKYSTADLNEIARVYAYSYADEDIYNPKGKEFAELERLMKKHHLETDSQYDGDLGGDVYQKVAAAIEGAKGRQQWEQFAKQHKTAKSAFTQYYITKFMEDDEESYDAGMKAELTAVAKILAQAYEDTRNDKLSEKTIKDLSEDGAEYIDYDLYRDAFAKVSKSFKK